MSPVPKLVVRTEREDATLAVTVEPAAEVVVHAAPVNVPVVALGTMGPPGSQGPQGDQGPAGPQGPEGEWVKLTQAEYDALADKDPAVLYVVVG